MKTLQITISELILLIILSHVLFKMSSKLDFQKLINNV